MSKILIVDVSNLIFRAFYAIKPLNTSYGLPINAVYGFITMFTNLLNEHKPEYVAACLDSREISLRKQEFPDYKANRSAPPEELVPQFPLIKEFLESIKIPLYQMPGYEADDIIATISKYSCEHARNSGDHFEVLIVSGDKDLAQLVNDRVKLVDTMKNTVMDTQGVISKFGVRPDQIIDYLGLIGDSSDNIPGVDGIGPKTAEGLLKQFHSIDGIYENLNKLPKQKKYDNIKTSKEIAMLSRKLATVMYDVPINLNSIDELKYALDLSQENIRNDFLAFLQKLELNRLIDKFFHTDTPYQHDPNLYKAYKPEAANRNTGQSSNGKENQSIPVREIFDPIELPEISRVLIEDENSFLELIKELESANEFAFDTETDGLHYIDSRIVGMSFFVNGTAYYIPLRHSGFFVKQIDAQFAFDKLKNIFSSTDTNKLIIAHNLKFDSHMLLNEGIAINTKTFDTMIAAHILNASDRIGLDVLALKEFQFTMMGYEELCGKGKDKILFHEVEPQRALKYAADDAFITYELYKRYLPRLESENLHNLFYNVEMKLVNVLIEMERAGVKIDSEFLAKMSKDLEIELSQNEKEIYSLAGESEFNINSPKQLQEILFVKLKLPTGKKTKTGFSTDIEVLEELAQTHPIAKALVKHREISKLKSTYIDALPKLVSPTTHRVHTSFNQTVTATGRLSSTDPNLQNIPIKTARGKEIRKAFIAEKDYKILAFDYSQVELRVMAHFSNDKILTNAFLNNQDVHSTTAAEVFGVSLDQVTEQMRRAAKAINFGLIYGQSAFGLSEELSISRSEAAHYIDTYFARYSGVKEFMDTTVLEATKSGFVETLLGRKRYIPEIHSQNKNIKNNADRLAINTPIQGSAADIIKEAMISISEKLKNSPLGKENKTKMLLQVHDELVFECHKDYIEELVKLVLHEMEHIRELKVPLKVDYGIGDNWSET